MAKQINKPAGSRRMPIRPGDYYHLKAIEKRMEPYVNYDVKELGPRYSDDGYEIYTNKEQRRDADLQRAEMKARTRMDAIKRKRAGPNNERSTEIRAGRKPLKV